MNKGHNAETATVALTCPIKYMKKSYNFIKSLQCIVDESRPPLWALTQPTKNAECDEEDHTNSQYLLRLHNKLSTVWCRQIRCNLEKMCAHCLPTGQPAASQQCTIYFRMLAVAGRRKRRSREEDERRSAHRTGASGRRYCPTMEIYWSVHLSDETHISSTKLFCAYRAHNGCDARFVRRIFGIHFQRRDFRQIFEDELDCGYTAPSIEAMLEVDAANYIQYYEEGEWNLTNMREEGGKRKLKSSSLSTVDTKLVRIFSSAKYRLIYITFYLYALGMIRASLSAQFSSLIEPCRYTVRRFFLRENGKCSESTKWNEN